MKSIIVLLSVSFLVLFSLTNCSKSAPAQVTDTLTYTLTLQPGPDEGQNTLVTSDLYAALNLNGNPDINAGAWTYGAQGGGTGIARTYLKFIGLDGMPDSAIIISAKLSLYGISSGVAAPQGNSTDIDNSAWIKRLTSDWNPDSVTWNNKPSEIDLHKVSVPASTSVWNNDALDLDVTQLVDDLLNENNYGFVLEQQTEEVYRTMSFASCKVADPAKWPKLVVVYKIYKHQN